MSRWTHSPAPAQATHKGPPRHGDGLATSAASTRVVLTSAQTYFAIAQTDRAGSTGTGSAIQLTTDRRTVRATTRNGCLQNERSGPKAAHSRVLCVRASSAAAREGGPS